MQVAQQAGPRASYRRGSGRRPRISKGLHSFLNFRFPNFPCPPSTLAADPSEEIHPSPSATAPTMVHPARLRGSARPPARGNPGRPSSQPPPWERSPAANLRRPSFTIFSFRIPKSQIRNFLRSSFNPFPSRLASRLIASRLSFGSHAFPPKRSKAGLAAGPQRSSGTVKPYATAVLLSSFWAKTFSPSWWSLRVAAALAGACRWASVLPLRARMPACSMS